jgi:hypothetical protein
MDIKICADVQSIFTPALISELSELWLYSQDREIKTIGVRGFGAGQVSHPSFKSQDETPLNEYLKRMIAAHAGAMR